MPRARYIPNYEGVKMIGAANPFAPAASLLENMQKSALEEKKATADIGYKNALRADAENNTAYNKEWKPKTAQSEMGYREKLGNQADATTDSTNVKTALTKKYGEQQVKAELDKSAADFNLTKTNTAYVPLNYGLNAAKTNASITDAKESRDIQRQNANTHEQTAAANTYNSLTKQPSNPPYQNALSEMIGGATEKKKSGPFWGLFD